MYTPAAFQQHRRSAQARSVTRARLTAELLEARNLLDGGFANVLVNDPTADYPWLGTVPWIGTQQLIPADTQSETAIALAGNRIVVAYNDSNHFRTREWQAPTEELHMTGFAVSKDGARHFKTWAAFPMNPSTTILVILSWLSATRPVRLSW